VGSVSDYLRQGAKTYGMQEIKNFNYFSSFVESWRRTGGRRRARANDKNRSGGNRIGEGLLSEDRADEIRERRRVEMRERMKRMKKIEMNKQERMARTVEQMAKSGELITDSSESNEERVEASAVIQSELLKGLETAWDATNGNRERVDSRSGRANSSSQKRFGELEKHT
jgi:hypothetical protein